MVSRQKKGSRYVFIRRGVAASLINYFANEVRHGIVFILIGAIAGCSESGSESFAGNSRPTVTAGTDMSAIEGESVQLLGAGRDAEGAASFAWQQVAGPAVKLSNPEASDPSFTAPKVNEDVALTFILTVTDREGLAAADGVTVTVRESGGESGRGAGLYKT